MGSIMVALTYDDIPLELRPEEHLSLRTVADNSWASAKVELEMVQLLMFAPIFFRQKALYPLCMTLTLKINWEESPLLTIDGLS